MIPPNSKKIHEQINQYRKQNSTRILWPDYQIYDLLQAQVPIYNISSHLSNQIAYKILYCESNWKEYSDQILAKEYTHLFVIFRNVRNQKMAKIKNIFLILTKRPFAIDEIRSKFNATTSDYSITIKLNQLDRSMNIWGLKYTTTQNHYLVTPQSIEKRGLSYFAYLHTKLQVKSLLFYFTKRLPRYSEHLHYENKMPRDAKMIQWMNFRMFNSYLENQFVNCNQNLNIKIPIYQGNFRLSQKINFNTEIKQKSESQKYKVSQKIVKKNVDKKQMIPAATHRNNSKIYLLNKSIASIPHQKQQKKILHTQLIYYFSTIINPSKEDLIELQDTILQNFGQQSYELQFLQKILSAQQQLNEYLNCPKFKQNKYRNIINQAKSLNNQRYLLGNLIVLKCQKELLNGQQWLDLYYFVYSLKYRNLNDETDQQSQDIQKANFLKKSLQLLCIYFQEKCIQIISNCIKNIDKFQEIEDQQFNAQITKLINKCYSYYKNNVVLISDILYFRMKILNKENIIEMYHQIKPKLIYNSAQRHILIKSIQQRLQEYFCDYQNNYCIGTSKNTIINLDDIVQIKEDRSSQISNFENQQFNESFLVYHHHSFLTNIKLRQSIFQNHIFIFESFTNSQEVFQPILIMQNNKIIFFIQKCFVQASLTHEAQKINFVKINIQILVNHKLKLQSVMVANLSSLNYSEGIQFDFNQELSQIQEIEFKIYFENLPELTSVMAYLKMRLHDLLYLPKFQQRNFASDENKNVCQNKFVEANSNLRKRQSSFYLERKHMMYNEEDIKLDMSCFYHAKCQLCKHILLKYSIYSMHITHFHYLLLVYPFRSEIQTFASLYKYILQNNLCQNSIKYMLSVIRIKYLPLRSLIRLRSQIAHESNNFQILQTLIESKIRDQINESGQKQSKKQKLNFLTNQPRPVEDYWIYIQPEYSSCFTQKLVS